MFNLKYFIMKRVIVFLVFGFLICGGLIINSCKKEDVIPTLTTSAVTDITINSGTTGGLISKDGGAAVTARGVCWATTSSPVISGSHSSDGSGTGSFTSDITGLTPNTLYHVRAYATNKVGTAYGNDVTFTTTPIVLATLTTTEVSSITLTTAVSGGNVTADGGGAVTARGVCWATTTAPTITNSLTTDGTGSGSFTSNLAALLPATTYYIRAYATNSAGTAYGNEISFTTASILVPVLTTTVVTSITLTSAISGGTITSNGGALITASGICWATTLNPVVTDSHTTDGTVTGSFPSSLTGLTAGTTYHVRAYATNSVGTAYGNDVSFTTTSTTTTLTTTVPTSITLISAVSGGTIISNGGAAITVSGICWATTPNPAVTDSHTTDGTLTGSFPSTMTGLSAGTTYHVRAYATNSNGTAYGNDLSFTTTTTTATLTTTAPSSITLTTAVSGGTITSNGGAAITVSGICWATTANPIATGSHTTDGTTSGTFPSTMTGLLAGTTYHVRAYATNSNGTAYGNDLSFTTTTTTATLTTAVPSSITLTSAVSGGTITSNGGATITVSGICWSTSSNPIATNSHTTDGTTSGSFVSSLTGLSAGTTYYVRAYATNSAGTGYGNDLSFTTTAPTVPILTTAAISSIDVTSAVSGGTITSNGGATITVSGICWATTPTPLATGSHTTDGTTSGSFSSNLTLLTGGTPYYVRAYATNSIGTAYGNQLIFNTKLADVDGNKYNIVVIGTQIWMAENLKTTKFNDNTTLIPNVTDNTAWTLLNTPAYCWYNNDGTTYKPIYGAIYNWFTIDATSNGGKNVCPTGWHAPSDVEFQTLELYLGITPADVVTWGYRGTNQGSQMKNTTGWTTGENGTNTSGFSALPGGYRYGESGTFNDVGNLSYWWSTSAVDASTAYYRRLDGILPDVPTNNQVFRGGVLYQAGKYVRCVKN
jgi:uncharacterized protein (TIGR02145 family)